MGTASWGLMRLVTKLQCLGSLSSRVALASQPLYSPKPRLPLWDVVRGARSVAQPHPGLTWGPHLVLSMSSDSGNRTPTRG